MNREENRRKFKARLKNFDVSSAVTGLTIDDLDWCLSSGELVRPAVLGRSYPPQNHPFEASFDPTSFLPLTAYQIVASGSSASLVPEISDLVFRRVMKTLVNYCNFMYRRAVFKGRLLISIYELHDLLEQDDIEFHLYFNEFYPRIRPNQIPVIPGHSDYFEKLPLDDPNNATACPVFRNLHTAHLHHLYHHVPSKTSIYHSYECKRQSDLQDARQKLNVILYRQQVMQLNLDRQYDPFSRTFLSPFNELSVSYSHRFYEALGMPPIETEMIMVLGWISRRLINKIVQKAVLNCDRQRRNNYPNLEDYKNVMTEIDDPLFNVEMSFADPLEEISPVYIARFMDRPQCHTDYYLNRKVKAKKRRDHRREIFEYHNEVTQRGHSGIISKSISNIERFP